MLYYVRQSVFHPKLIIYNCFLNFCSIQPVQNIPLMAVCRVLNMDFCGEIVLKQFFCEANQRKMNILKNFFDGLILCEKFDYHV